MKPIPIIFRLFLCVIPASFFHETLAQEIRLNHIALYVTDLRTSAAFYTDVIGLDTIPEPFHDGKHTWFSIGPKSHLHIIEAGKERLPQNKNTHLCFTVASVEKFVETLNKKNIPFEDWTGNKQKIQIRVDGVKQVYFRDPDGFWIEINDARE